MNATKVFGQNDPFGVGIFEKMWLGTEINMEKWHLTPRSSWSLVQGIASCSIVGASCLWCYTELPWLCLHMQVAMSFRIKVSEFKVNKKIKEILPHWLTFCEPEDAVEFDGVGNLWWNGTLWQNAITPLLNHSKHSKRLSGLNLKTSNHRSLPGGCSASAIRQKSLEQLGSGLQLLNHLTSHWQIQDFLKFMLVKNPETPLLSGTEVWSFWPLNLLPGRPLSVASGSPRRRW